MENEQERKAPSEEEIKERLNSNPEIQKYFSQFNSVSIQRFIDKYCETLHYGFKNEIVNQGVINDRSVEFLNIAMKRLWEIQQKKLFNLQCKWRAENITIPGIESTYDFAIWEESIEICPFLEPITQPELDLYIDFLHNESINFLFFVDYQNYNSFKEEREDESGESSMPEWYYFYDLRMGTTSLLNLPDIRGDKEKFYLKLYSDERKLKLKEQNKNITEADPVEEDTRPWIDTYYKDIVKFNKRFDDSHTQRCIQLQSKAIEEQFEHHEIDPDIDFLKRFGDDIPFEPHSNWRDSLSLTVHKLKNRLTAEAMPAAYQDYLMRLQTGVGYSGYLEEKDEHDIDWKEYYAKIKMKILRGRELNGEPQDWNF